MTYYLVFVTHKMIYCFHADFGCRVAQPIIEWNCSCLHKSDFAINDAVMIIKCDISTSNNYIAKHVVLMYMEIKVYVT